MMKLSRQDIEEHLEEYKKYFDGFVLFFPFNRNFEEIKLLPAGFKYILLVNCFCNINCSGDFHWYADSSILPKPCPNSKYIKNIEINVYRIKNNFFGETITVSGLLTATDLIDQLKDKDLGETLYITRSMMKADEEIFLDNITLKELEEKLNIEVVPCQNEGIDVVDKVTK